MVLSHLQNERETERKEKSQLLEHRCTVMVRSGCWSACLNSDGAITGAVGAYHAIECIGFPARVPCVHGSSHARHVGIQLPACCLYDKIHDMSDPPTCCFVWAYTLNVSWACSDFFTMFLCTSPFGPSCLSDVNIITCRKTQIFEVSLMLISSGAEKQESLNFIWG